MVIIQKPSTLKGLHNENGDQQMINEYEGLVRLMLMSREQQESHKATIEETARTLVDVLDKNRIPMATAMSAMFYVMIRMQQHAHFPGENLRLMFERMTVVSQEIDNIKGL